MGGLFSWLANTDQSDIEKEKKFQEEIAKYQEQIDDFNKNYEQHIVERKEQINKIYEERSKLIKERIEELIYIDNRYKELKEQRKNINNRASAYICSILFNYYSENVLRADNINKADGCEFQKEMLDAFDKVLFPKADKDLNILVFGQLSQIAPLLPLIWPTGIKDSQLHEEYVTNTDGSPNMLEHATAVNTWIRKYIRGNLRRYTFNVCYANCYEHMYSLDEKAIKEYETACEEYRERALECLTNDSFVSVTYDFLKQFKKPIDIMRLKMLQAKSRKGISINTPKLLPPYYPKCCPVYELYEAVLMCVNTICYGYGSITDNGKEVIADYGTTSTNATHKCGKCFEIPEKYIDKVYEKYFNMDPNKVWDYTGANFAAVNDSNFLVPIEEITGTSDNAVWMKQTTICEELEVVGAGGSAERKGKLKYVNPTRKYTYQLMNDDENANEKIKLTKISADMSELFRENLLYNLTTSLMDKSDPNIGKYSVYNSSYRPFFYSMDYLTIAPADYKLINGISPLAQYVYNMVLVNGVQWNLIFPIDNTMTLSKINKKVTDLVDNDSLFQYIWAGNEKILNEGHDQTPTETKEFNIYFVKPINKTMTWHFEHEYNAWLDQNPPTLLATDNPSKDDYWVFDV